MYEEKAKAANWGHEEFMETIVSQPMTMAEMEGLYFIVLLLLIIIFMNQI